AAVAVATIVNLGVRFVRWQFVLRRLGVRLPTMPSLAAYVGSFAFLPVPLYLGQLYARTRLVPASADERGAIVLAFLVEAASSAWALAVLATPLLPATVGVAVVAAGGLLLVPGVVRTLTALARPLAGLVAGTAPARDAGAPLVRPEVWAPALALSLAAWAPVAAAV